MPYLDNKIPFNFPVLPVDTDEVDEVTGFDGNLMDEGDAPSLVMNEMNFPAMKTSAQSGNYFSSFEPKK